MHMYIWAYVILAVLALMIILGIKLKNMINDMIDNKLNKHLHLYTSYPKININYEWTGKPIHFEFPYLLTGTCNEIDYIGQRLKERPTPFEIDRFRHHCIYEYEKSGKSKVIKYEAIDKDGKVIEYEAIDKDGDGYK